MEEGTVKENDSDRTPGSFYGIEFKKEYEKYVEKRGKPLVTNIFHDNYRTKTIVYRTTSKEIHDYWCNSLTSLGLEFTIYKN